MLPAPETVVEAAAAVFLRRPGITKLLSARSRSHSTAAGSAAEDTSKEEAAFCGEVPPLPPPVVPVLLVLSTCSLDEATALLRFDDDAAAG